MSYPIKALCHRCSRWQAFVHRVNTLPIKRTLYVQSNLISVSRFLGPTNGSSCPNLHSQACHHPAKTRPLGHKSYAFEHPRVPSGVCIPQPYCPIITSTGECAAVRTKSESCNIAFMSFKRSVVSAGASVHKRISLSVPSPLASVLPSGENATALTSPVCPLRICKGRQFLRPTDGRYHRCSHSRVCFHPANKSTSQRNPNVHSVFACAALSLRPTSGWYCPSCRSQACCHQG